MNLKSFTKFIAAAGCVLSASSHAIPIDPSERDVSGLFDIETQSNFHLYADSYDPNLVWFVAKSGTIRLDANRYSDAPRPRFNIGTRVPFTGFFAGQELVSIGGAFDTTGLKGELASLERQAHDLGMRISPAPASKAKTSFLLNDIDIGDDGRATVDCEFVEISINGYVVEVPVCSTQNIDGEMVDATVFSTFSSRSPRGNTTASTNIPFQATTFPEQTFIYEDLMYAGAQWDNQIQAIVEWDLTTIRPTRVGRVVIDWATTFEQLSTFAAVHNWACIDIEVQAFFKRLAENQNGETGVTIEFMQPDGSFSNQPINDQQFEQALQALEKELRDELFVELRDYRESQLGQVDTDTNAVFTLRANYEKLVFKRNETRYLYWSPGNTIQNPVTTMTLDCMVGGFGQRVEWDMTQDSCREIADKL